jgi:hypothetical protein
MEPHFVAFHVQPSQATLARIVEDCRTFDTDAADYHTLLDIVFRSARHHPGAKTALISDREMEFDRLSPETPLIRIDVDPSASRTAGWSGRSTTPAITRGDAPFVFLDSDVVINADLARCSVRASTSLSPIVTTDTRR